MKSGKSKRPDIQTFRSLAICSVLAFHLRSDLFPLGYLGVDIFFVLSGYLMSLMLSRVENLNAKNVMHFYWRRVSRILPMYCVVICAVAILSRFVLSPIDYSTLVRDIRWSLVFGANMEQLIDGSDYWAQVNDSPILLHMWSLGAEVQYYLIVPLIVLLQRCFKSKAHQLIFLGFLTIASFVLFLISNETAAFLLMPDRAWQFIVGSIAFEIDSDEEDDFEDLDDLNLITNKKEPVSTSRVITSIFIVLSLVCFSPLQVPIRLPVSIFTALLLLYGSQKEIGLLSNRWVVKLGNASYVIYLVHWPVITLYKYSREVKTLDNIDIILCLVYIIMISIVLHEFCEKKLLNASVKTTLAFVAIFYATTLIVTSFELKSNVDNVTDKRYNYKDVINWNTKMTGNTGRGDCKWDSEGAKWSAPYKDEPGNRCVAPGKGTARILIIGNSFAGIVANYLRPMLKPIAKEIRLFAHHGCRILINGTCPPFSAAWPRVMEQMKPDVTWIISRNHSKFVVLDYQTVGIMLYPSMYPPKMILRRIDQGNYDFDDLKVTEKEWKEYARNETLRMDKIDNPKLIRHKISEKQCTDGNCFFYNPANLHMYYSDNYAHPTSEQMALLKPSYSGIVDQLKKLIKL